MSNPYTPFRAGSGDYQAVRPLLLNITAIPANTTQVESYSVTAANIAASGGSIVDLTTDSMVLAIIALPKVTAVLGLIIDGAAITATGELSITWTNPTSGTITPAAATQVNIIVL